ncbi:MAG: hypothetical protein AAGD32_03560 [Planctomycetota bacterium]
MSIQTRVLVAAVAVSAASSLAVAQTGPELLLNPLPEDVEFETMTHALIFETGSTSDGFSAGLDIFQSEGRLRIPGGEDDILRRAQARVGYNITHLYLDTGDPLLPEELVDVSIGYGMGLFQSEDKTIVAGLTLGVGYAGAGAFDDGNAWYALANLAVGKEFTQNGKYFKAGDRFGVVINFDGNRTIFPDFPLLGFQYTRPVTEELELSVGFPFSSVTWRPDDNWEIRLNYSLPDSFTGRIDYGFREGFGIFGEIAGQSEAFAVDDLPNGNDRILFQQSRLEMGLRYRVQETKDYRANAILAIGYAFDTEFNVGFDVRDEDSLTDISDEAYVRAAVELRF